MRVKGPHRPEFVCYLVRAHSLITYMDVIEYKIVSDTETPFPRCFLLISKLKAGDIITTGRCMNYQTFKILQFRSLLNKFFHKFQID